MSDQRRFKWKSGRLISTPLTGFWQAGTLDGPWDPAIPNLPLATTEVAAAADQNSGDEWNWSDDGGAGDADATSMAIIETPQVQLPPVIVNFEDPLDFTTEDGYDDPVIDLAEAKGPVQPQAPPPSTRQVILSGLPAPVYLSEIGSQQQVLPGLRHTEGATNTIQPPIADTAWDWDSLAQDDLPLDDAQADAPVIADQPPQDEPWAWSDGADDDFQPPDQHDLTSDAAPGDAWDWFAPEADDPWQEDQTQEFLPQLTFQDEWDWHELDAGEEFIVEDPPQVSLEVNGYDDAWDWTAEVEDFAPVESLQADGDAPFDDAWQWSDDAADEWAVDDQPQAGDAAADDPWLWADEVTDEWIDDATLEAAPTAADQPPAHEWLWGDEDLDEPPWTDVWVKPATPAASTKQTILAGLPTPVYQNETGARQQILTGVYANDAGTNAPFDLAPADAWCWDRADDPADEWWTDEVAQVSLAQPANGPQDQDWNWQEVTEEFLRFDDPTLPSGPVQSTRQTIVAGLPTPVYVNEIGARTLVLTGVTHTSGSNNLPPVPIQSQQEWEFLTEVDDDIQSFMDVGRPASTNPTVRQTILVGLPTPVYHNETGTRQEVLPGVHHTNGSNNVPSTPPPASPGSSQELDDFGVEVEDDFFDDFGNEDTDWLDRDPWEWFQSDVPDDQWWGSEEVPFQNVTGFAKQFDDFQWDWHESADDAPTLQEHAIVGRAPTFRQTILAGWPTPVYQNETEPRGEILPGVYYTSGALNRSLIFQQHEWAQEETEDDSRWFETPYFQTNLVELPSQQYEEAWDWNQDVGDEFDATDPVGPAGPEQPVPPDAYDHWAIEVEDEFGTIEFSNFDAPAILQDDIFEPEPADDEWWTEYAQDIHADAPTDLEAQTYAEDWHWNGEDTDDSDWWQWATDPIAPAPLLAALGPDDAWPWDDFPEDDHWWSDFRWDQFEEPPAKTDEWAREDRVDDDNWWLNLTHDLVNPVERVNDTEQSEDDSTDDPWWFRDDYQNQAFVPLAGPALDDTQIRGEDGAADDPWWFAGASDAQNLTADHVEAAHILVAPSVAYVLTPESSASALHVPDVKFVLEPNSVVFAMEEPEATSQLIEPPVAFGEGDTG